MVNPLPDQRLGNHEGHKKSIESRDELMAWIRVYGTRVISNPMPILEKLSYLGGKLKWFVISSLLNII
jgi:hypothetical protein